MTEQKSKRVDQLLISDTIVEVIVEVSKGRSKTRAQRYKVLGVKPAACSAYKTHVTVEGSRHWCYDSAQEVQVV